MGFKTILVPLNGGGLNKAVLATAVAAAQRFAAHLEVLFVRPDPQAALPFATMGMTGSLKKAVIDAAVRNSAEKAAQVRSAFEQLCRENEITISGDPSDRAKPTAARREETGRENEVLTQRGRLSDLIFVVRPDESPFAAQTLETALMETGRPVVVVPPTPQPCIASRITIGWNASAEAARAVAEAMPCLTSADNVTVLASQTRAASAQDLADYLIWHGIEPALKIFETGSRSVGETLLAESREFGADLLVVGGYTHTRARQLLFGGVTRHIFEAADIPVLMAH